MLLFHCDPFVSSDCPAVTQGEGDWEDSGRVIGRRQKHVRSIILYNILCLLGIIFHNITY